MNTHLKDDELTAAIAGLDISPEAAEHLASCVSCRQQAAGIRQSIDERLTAMEAEHPDWQRQQRDVMARLPEAPEVGRSTGWRWLRPVLAAAAVLVIAVGLKLSMAPVVVTTPVTDDLQIEQILAEVDAVLADDSLPGFEPIDPGVDDPASIFENGSS